MNFKIGMRVTVLRKPTRKEAEDFYNHCAWPPAMNEIIGKTGTINHITEGTGIFIAFDQYDLNNYPFGGWWLPPEALVPPIDYTTLPFGGEG